MPSRGTMRCSVEKIGHVSERYVAHGKGTSTARGVLMYSSPTDTDIPACPQHRFSRAIQKGRDGNEWKKPSHHLCFDPSPISVTQSLAFSIVSVPSGTNSSTVMWTRRATEQKMIKSTCRTGSIWRGVLGPGYSKQTLRREQDTSSRKL